MACGPTYRRRGSVQSAASAARIRRVSDLQIVIAALFVSAAGLRAPNRTGAGRVYPDMRKALVIVPLVLVLAGLAATGYAAAGTKHATVKTRGSAAFGSHLVDGRGRTLYRFMKDTGRHSRCTGTCAAAWPPLMSRERPEARGGAKASRLSTVRRTGGGRQVDYAGHPLYRYSGDAKPGDTSGEGINAFGGRWYLVAPSGGVVKGPSSPAPSGGYGY
jgi:predicted lipoprotein with Yx(FWY)xxD motif